MTTPRQKRSSLRMSDIRQLPKLSDEQLLELANGRHDEFLGAMRKAIVEHARIAGAALLELKKRAGHGNWADWLRQNFSGSVETAQVYMKIAKGWPLLQRKLGRELKDASLEQLRRALAKPVPGEERRKKQARRSTKAQPNVKDDGRLPYELSLSPNQKESLASWARDLTDEFKTTDPSLVVYRAVERVYMEVHGEKDQPHAPAA